MHLSSTINSLSKSEGNVPVSMFVFGTKQTFLPVFEDYEETTQNVARVFGIKLVSNDSITFSTSTLDVCGGKDVVIDPSAYPLMWTVLDEIHVSVNVIIPVGKHNNDEEMQRPGKAPHTIQVPRASAIPSSSLQRQRKAHSSTPLVDIEVPRSKTYLPPLDLGKAKTKMAGVDFLDSPQDDDDFLGLDTPSDHGGEEGPPWNFSDKYTRKGRGEGGSGESKLSKAPAGSSSKNVVQSNPVATNYGTRLQVMREKLDKSRQASESMQEELVALKWSTSHRSILKEKAPSISTIEVVDDPLFGHLDGTDGPQVKKEEVDKFRQAGESTQEELKRSTVRKEKKPFVNDPHFEIYIRGPEPNQTAQFKMRGGHPVRKVLQAACKAFGLDYECSHLVLSVVADFECPVDETMARCGVNAGSKLFVKVDQGLDD